MHSSIASYRSWAFVVPLACLVAAALLLRPLERRLAFDTGQVTAVARGGGTIAILGGMRSVLASGFWLRTNLAWEKRDVATTTALIELTVAADERPLYFWLNAARMIAYDMPEWSREEVPAAVWRRMQEQRAQQALALLNKSIRWHGSSAYLHIEMANIFLRRLGDLSSAAHCYRLAAEQPDAPYYASRIHAELLRELGRSGEALDWLRAILPDLPADDPAARRDVVLNRIKDLELELAAD